LNSIVSIRKELVIDSGNGRESKIAFKSYEQARGKAQGAGKVLIWFDEEPPKDIFDECSVRTEAGIALYMILTMTPVKGMTWVYNEIYLNTSNPDIFVSGASWEDNSWLLPEQQAQMRRRLPPRLSWSARRASSRADGSRVLLVRARRPRDRHDRVAARRHALRPPLRLLKSIVQPVGPHRPRVQLVAVRWFLAP